MRKKPTVRPPRQGLREPRSGPRKEIAAGLPSLVPEHDDDKDARLPEESDDRFRVK